MDRKINLLLLGTFVGLLVGLATITSATPTAAPTNGACPTGPVSTRQALKLSLNVCGPTRVVRGTNHDYTVVLANYGDERYARVKLAVVHYDRLVRTSVPFRREARPSYAPMSAAVWTRKTFWPGNVFRVRISLPFRQQSDPKGSNFMVEARVPGRSGRVGFMKDVVFVGHS
jgi:hypothetical protein